VRADSAWEDFRKSRAIFQSLKRLRGGEKWKYFDEICAKRQANVFHCNLMMSASTSMQGRKELLARMRDMKVAADVVTYSTFIDKAVKGGSMDVAEQALDEMAAVGIQPNAYTFSALIDGYGKRKMLNEARGTWDRMMLLGVAPATHTYTSLMDALGKVGDAAGAEKLFHHLLNETSLEPTCAFFTTMVDAHTRQGNIAAVRRVAEIAEETEGFRPDASLYNSVLNAADKIADLPDVMEVLGRMEERGVAPDIVTWTCLVDAHGKRGLVKEAEGYMQCLRDAGFVPDGIAYSALVDAYGKVGRHAEAAATLKEMRGLGLPTVDAATALIDSFCRNGDLDKAESLLSEMKERGGHDAPRVEAYTALMMGYSLEGKSRTAEEVHGEMIEAGIAPDAGYFQTYLTIMREARNYAAARDGFQRAVDEGLEPFASCVTVGKSMVRLDVHGMSPGAAVAAVEWVLRKVVPNGRDLVIVTGKEITYTYDHNQLREATEDVLKELTVKWKVSKEVSWRQEPGGRLIVSAKEWRLFRKRGNLPVVNTKSVEEEAEMGFLLHQEDGIDGDLDKCWVHQQSE